MAKPLFFYSAEMLRYDMGPQHPMQPRRLRMTYDLLDSYGVFAEGLEVVNPALADPAEVAETHSAEFVATLQQVNEGRPSAAAYRHGLGTGDNPLFPGIYEASLRYTGASVGAAQAVLDGAQVAFNIAGGLHHAHYDRAAGFCVLNDCAIAIHRLRRKFARVAYVDIDVHHGDGVQELFYNDPTVLTISLHESGRTLYPGTGFVQEIGEGAGEGYSVNLPFAPGTLDDLWLASWREGVLPILQAFNPDAILLQTGADAHYLDPLAHLCLTAQGWLEAVEDVQALGKPIVAVGGGGYNMTTVPRMWACMVATLADIPLSDAVPTTYAHHDTIPFLTDHQIPVLHERDLQRAEQVAAQSVAEVKRLLFPHFGLNRQ